MSCRLASCRIWLLGDIIEGDDIFAGQVFEIDRSLIEQITAAATMLEEFVLACLGFFEHVHVCGVPGNHGRIGRHGQHHKQLHHTLALN